MITLVAEFNGEVWHNELCHYMVEIILENPNCNFCNLFCLFLIAKMQRFIFMTFAE